MILTITPEKDSYITNLKTRNTDCSYANTGHAATLDLFKLYNENKYAHSKFYLKLNNIFQNIDDFNNCEIKLTDYNNKELYILLNNTIPYINSGFINDKYNIGIQDIQTNILLFNINEKLNFLQENAFIDIVSYYNDEILVLKQNKSGISGDKQIIINGNNNQSLFNILVNNDYYFSRIDFSTILIKFNIKDFKQKWIKIDNNNNMIDENSSFSNMKVLLKLKDTTMGNTKPFNFNINAYKLKKDFNEGKGRDTINFSDYDNCNFINLNKDETWQIPEFIHSNNDIDLVAIGTSNDFNLGNEDLEIDITSYFIEKTLNDDDKGLLLTFSDEFLFNNKSYFVKRFGSKHLLNKSFIPVLEVHIDEYQNFINYENSLERLIDKNETFYIFNAKEIAGYTLKYRFLLDKDDKDNILKSGEIIDFIYDIKGNQIENSFKFNETIEYELIKSNKSFIYLDLFYDNGLEEIILNQTKYSYINDFSIGKKINSYENCIIRFDHELNANNSIYNMSVTITDTKKFFNSVKIPYELKSEYYGEFINYRIIDADNNKVLVQNNDFSTKLYWNNKDYITSIFIPDFYKHKRLKFEFIIKENDSSIERVILNEKQIFKVN